jgi:hypothetical protein
MIEGNGIHDALVDAAEREANDILRGQRQRGVSVEVAGIAAALLAGRAAASLAGSDEEALEAVLGSLKRVLDMHARQRRNKETVTMN